MRTIKITKEDQFIWLVVTGKAKEIYLSGLFDLYALYDDDSETLITGFTQLSEALENGLDIGVEVGFISNNIDLFEHYKRMPEKIRNIIDSYSNTENFSYQVCDAMLKELEANGYTFDYGLDAEPFNLRPYGE